MFSAAKSLRVSPLLSIRQHCRSRELTSIPTNNFMGNTSFLVGMGLDFWGCPQRPRRSSPSPIRTRPGPWAPWELLSPSMVAGGNSLRVRSSNEDWGCRLFKVVLATGGISSSPNNPKSIVWEHPKKSNPYFIKIPLGKQGEVEEYYW